MKKYAYGIYQLKNIKTDYAWMWWDYAKDKFNIEDYHCIYNSEIEADTEIDALEKLFEQFNLYHPKDFRGHSMSVSDVVTLTENNNTDWYYCDMLGWKKLNKII